MRSLPWKASGKPAFCKAVLALCSTDQDCYLENSCVERLHAGFVRVSAAVFDQGGEYESRREFQQFVFLSAVQAGPLCNNALVNLSSFGQGNLSGHTLHSLSSDPLRSYQHCRCNAFLRQLQTGKIPASSATWLIPCELWTSNHTFVDHQCFATTSCSRPHTANSTSIASEIHHVVPNVLRIFAVFSGCKLKGITHCRKQIVPPRLLASRLQVGFELTHVNSQWGIS